MSEPAETDASREASQVVLARDRGVSPVRGGGRPGAESRAAPGTLVDGRFRLERELGQGGMGSVWLARHVALDVQCAVKFIHDDLGAIPELVARFEREARLCARLRHPHIVEVLDCGQWEQTPYLVMEYLAGEDLGRRLGQRGRLGLAETAELVGQIARGLQKAHASGLVHRDLKPENVFIAKQDEGETVKLLDFGIVKVPDAKSFATAAGAMIGTPSYMSPEQARGVSTVDHRSDLWSLGVIAFQCLTGELPFEDQALCALLMVIMTGEPRLPSSVDPELPPELDAWWLRAAARDPERRFQSAAELANALAAIAGVRLAGCDGVSSSHSPLPIAPLGPPVLPREPSTPGVAHTCVNAPKPEQPQGPPAAALAVAFLAQLILLTAIGFALLPRPPADATRGLAAAAAKMPRLEAPPLPETVTVVPGAELEPSPALPPAPAVATASAPRKPKAQRPSSNARPESRPTRAPSRWSGPGF